MRLDFWLCMKCNAADEPVQCHVQVEVGASHKLADFSTAGCTIAVGLQVINPLLLLGPVALGHRQSTAAALHRHCLLSAVPLDIYDFSLHKPLSNLQHPSTLHRSHPC